MKTLQLAGDSKYGGGSYLLFEWCKYLIARGCQVDVLSTDEENVQALHNIHHLNVISDIYIPREIDIGTDCKAFVNLLRLLSKEKYDVVHTYSATPGFIGRLAAWVSNVPAIFHHQAGWTVTEFSTWKERLFYTPLEYIATLLSTRGICVSQAVAYQAREFHIAPLNKLVTICNGINSSPFIKADKNMSVLYKKLGLSEDIFIIGSTGRLSKQKDYFTLLYAGARLKQLRPEGSFAMVIVGDGPNRISLESLANKLGISDIVHFVGFRSDIPELLAGMNIYISTSLWEGLSISLLEAMAAARSIVATAIFPNAELIKHEITGLLVKPRSPEDVVNAIIRFMDDPELARCCGETAQNLVLNEYTLEKMFEQTWKLYVSFVS